MTEPVKPDVLAPPVVAPPAAAVPPPSPPPPPPPPPPPKKETNYWAFVILFVFIAVILILIANSAPVIDKLSDPAFARGLITFIICMSTIGLAFMLVYQAFFAEESDDNRFRRAREIFAGLMGILGTIVGFYFGSATTESLAPQAATLQIGDTEIVSYITGGTPPYRLTLAIEGQYVDTSPLKISKSFISEDGWVRYRFEKAVSKASAELAVKDARNITASTKGEKKEAEPAKPAEPEPATKK